MNGEWTKLEKLGLEINSLYVYDDFARDQLLKFKDNDDKWLKDIFLSPHLSYFYLKFLTYKIVYAPSSQSKNQKRGYIPNKLILETQHLKVIDNVFKKHTDYKQSEMHRSQRHKIKDFITLEKPEAIKHQNILLFDDLCTTGNTLKACFDLINPLAKSVKVLALFHHEI